MPNSCKSLAEEVLENTDLLTYILLSFQAKVIFRVRCVSKRWNNIISDPHFVRCYDAKRRKEQLHDGACEPLLAFIQTNKSNGDASDFSQTTVSQVLPNPQIKMLCLATRMNEFRIKQAPSVCGHFLHASNGLILCGRNRGSLYVVNPITGKWIALPPPGILEFADVGLVCEENISEFIPDFKVVRFVRKIDNLHNSLWVETYFSKTGNWTTPKVVGTGDSKFQCYTPPHVFNGVFHWFPGGDKLVVYDSNIDKYNLQWITLPVGGVSVIGKAITRSLNDNVLWFAMNDKTSLKIWMLPENDECGSYGYSNTIPASEWILMHTFTSYYMHITMSIMLLDRDENGNVSRTVRLTPGTFTLIALLPGSPVVAVLSYRDRVFIESFRSKPIELVRLNDDSVWDTYDQNSWHLFTGPPSLSTYFL